MLRGCVWLVVLLVVSSCGRLEEPDTAAFYFETRELSPKEVEERGYFEAVDETVVTSVDEARVGQAVAGAGVSPLLVNSLAGVVQKVIEKEKVEMKTTVLGHAIPKGTQPINLVDSKPFSKVYEKKLVSSLLKADLVTLLYRVSYQYAAKHAKAGDYLLNVKFTPLKVDTSTLWSVRANAVSEEPINLGSAKVPVAQLSFAITFTAEGTGSGTRTVTDEFKVEAKEGKLSAENRKFD